MNLTSTSQIKKLLADHGLHPRKRLGQNFLIDRNVLNHLIEACDIVPGSKVLEIGPGLGVVTSELVEQGASVVCVETDKGFLPVLESILPIGCGAEIVIEDFLKIDLPEFLNNRGGGKWIVVGNLPYYITSPIIGKLIDSREYISTIHLMVQREVAQRLQGEAGSDDYSALTVFVQYYCEIQSILKVSRNVFYPIPDVDSELIKLTIREKPKADVLNEKLFFMIVKAAFGMRRKTLFNALSSSPELKWSKDYTRSVLEASGIDGGRRGETLSIEEFAKLSNSVVDEA